MQLVVSDTSPIRALYNVGCLNLLESLFQKVFVPPAVGLELKNPVGPHAPVDVAAISFFQVIAPSNSTAVALYRRDLDAGESEAIVLAMELGAKLLVDEAAGRKAAQKAGLKITGTLGLLVDAKKLGLIPALKPLLQEMRGTHGFFLQEDLVRQILAAVGETP